MQTDRLDKAHGFAYFLWKKHPDKCFMVWQERSQGSRGGYGPVGSVLAPSDDDVVDEGFDLDTISNVASKVTNFIPNFVSRAIAVGKKEGKETIDMLKLYKAKMSGTQLTPQQEQFMNEQWKDIAVVSIAALGLGYDTAALGATGAAANVGKDAALDPLVNKGLEVAAELLLAKFGIDIVKKLSQAFTTSTGAKLDKLQSRENSVAPNPELDARVNQQFHKAKMGFGGMTESTDYLDEK
jgi:hypothetical protein